MNSYSANNFFWWKANLYGSMTTRSEMLSDTYAQEQDYAWNTALHIGDSIFEAINYPGPPQNLWLYPNNYDNTYEKVWDYYISAMGTVYGTHYFVFMWSCGSANFIGAGIGSQGYPENPNGSWAMPYSWTKKNDLSSEGYGNPGGSAVFIGFQYWSKNLDEKDPNYPNGGTYSTFLQRFYYWAVQQHLSINRALDYAAKDITGNSQANLGWLKLRTGYQAYVPGYGNLWSHIRVFGNGAKAVPY